MEAPKKRPDHDFDPPPLPEAPKFKGLQKIFGGDGHTQALAQASAVGISFAVSIVLGLFGGLWLDKKLGSAPWCLLAGILIGIAAGFKNLFSVAARVDKLSRKSKDENV